MDQTLQLCRHPDGRRWQVLGADGAELAVTTGLAKATSWAVEYLNSHGGGSFRRYLPDGSIGPPTTVGPKPGAAVMTDQPAATPTPEAAVTRADSGRGQPSPPDEAEVAEDGRREALINAAERTAKVVDGLIGRKEPDGATNGIADLKIPAGNKTVRWLNTRMSMFGAWAALVALIFGTGTVVGVVKPALAASSGEATVGSYITFGQAFLATLSLSVCAALFVYLARIGKINGHGAVGLLVLACLAIIAVAHAWGFQGPTLEEAAEAASQQSGPPLAKLGAIFAGFFTFYGVVPFLVGLGAGFVAADLAVHIDRAEN